MTKTPVYIVPNGLMSRGRYHQDGNCLKLRSAKRISVIDLEDRGPRQPCAICTGRPVRYRKVICEDCSPKRLRPCAHNGGVLVEQTLPPVANSHTGEPVVRMVYVWPETALAYTSG